MRNTYRMSNNHKTHLNKRHFIFPMQHFFFLIRTRGKKKKKRARVTFYWGQEGKKVGCQKLTGTAEDKKCAASLLITGSWCPRAGKQPSCAFLVPISMLPLIFGPDALSLASQNYLHSQVEHELRGQELRGRAASFCLAQRRLIKCTSVSSVSGQKGWKHTG